MDVSQAVILSVVEGLSEFLPISSTGHLILASDILRIPQIEFVKSFEIIIQLGATLAIILIYTHYTHLHLHTLRVCKLDTFRYN